MPTPKKPRRKAEASPPEASAMEAIPDRWAMEEYLAATTRKQADDALSKAQNVIYDAWERRTSRSRAALAPQGAR